MKKDAVDDILGQWSGERPELDTASLGVVVRIMSLYKSFLRQATHALQPLNLELFEYDALSALRRQGRPYSLSPGQLARETGLSTGAVTNRIDRLEKRGFVAREPDEFDRRALRVRLTQAGRQIIDDAIGLRLEAAKESLGGLTKKEKSELVALLRKLVLATESGTD
jgi:DNA-binding MarR family transcriptional regulator